jgi:hypothetical protein
MAMDPVTGFNTINRLISFTKY